MPWQFHTDPNMSTLRDSDLLPLSLTDTQLALVADAARSVPVEKRSQFLERIAAILVHVGRRHFDDRHVAAFKD
jgi:hypothetical protein